MLAGRLSCWPRPYCLGGMAQGWGAGTPAVQPGSIHSCRIGTHKGLKCVQLQAQCAPESLGLCLVPWVCCDPAACLAAGRERAGEHGRPRGAERLRRDRQPGAGGPLPARVPGGPRATASPTPSDPASSAADFRDLAGAGSGLSAHSAGSAGSPRAAEEGAAQVQPAQGKP